MPRSAKLSIPTWREADLGLISWVAAEVGLIDHLTFVVVVIHLWRLPCLFFEKGVTHGHLIILTRHLLGIYHNPHLLLLFDGIPFFNPSLPINPSPLVSDAVLLVINVYVNDVKLVELLGPPLWDPVLNFVLQNLLVRTPRQSLRNWLLVKLEKLVVKLGNHLGSLFVQVQLFNNSLFYVSLCEPLDNISIWSDNQLRLDLRSYWLLPKNRFDARIFVLLKKINVAAAYIRDKLFIHLGNGWGWGHRKRRSARTLEVLWPKATHVLEFSLEASHILIGVLPSLDDVTVLGYLGR